MTYRGYTIIAELNVNSQWDFELDKDGAIQLTDFIDNGDADPDNLADFLVVDPDGDDVDWRDTLEDCKELIDATIKEG